MSREPWAPGSRAVLVPRLPKPKGAGSKPVVRFPALVVALVALIAATGGSAVTLPGKLHGNAIPPGGVVGALAGVAALDGVTFDVATGGQATSARPHLSLQALRKLAGQPIQSR